MYTTILTVQYLSIFLLLFLCTYIFAKWKTRTQGLLFLNCAVTLINNTGYLMAMLATTSEASLLGIQMSYLGRIWIPYTLLLFALKLCGKKLRKEIIIPLGIFHAFVYGLVLSAPWNRLYYSSITFVQGGIFPHNEYGHGIFHAIYTALMASYILIGLYILFVEIGKEKDQKSRVRLLWVTSAIAIECLFYVFEMMGTGDAYDVTVVGYAIASLMMAVAIFKYDLMDTLQLARDYVTDELAEGIIAVNMAGKIEYFNKPALNILPELKTDPFETMAEITFKAERGLTLERNDRIYTPEKKPLVHNGIERGTIYALIDDTEHYNYMKELEQKTAEAVRANESKSAFVSIVSHEIRTPMNAVVGMTELLLRDSTNLDEKQTKYLRNIANSGSSLVQIVNDILDQSKIEAGKMEIVEGPYSIRPLVDDVRMIVENRIGNKPIEVITEISDYIPQTMIGDSLRIRQILINLMNNAVKFTERGFIKLTITNEGVSQDSISVRFAIEDSGQGIKEEDLKLIGEAFTQVDTQKNHLKEGTGLGLSISKDFIMMMGGELKIESEYGKGTVFHFTIDQAIEQEPQAECENSEFVAPDARILIVDDTEINLMIAEELLSPLEIGIDTAESGKKALEMIQKNEYHAVFMDYMMPGMDGVETTRTIRELANENQDKAEYYTSLPVIALSGDSSDETRDAFRNAGISDFTDKPIEYLKVVRILEKWLPAQLIERN